MTIKSVYMAILGLLLCVACTTQAQAERQKLNAKFKTTKASGLMSCASKMDRAQPSSIHVHSKDNHNIKLARAFTTHLEKKGQNSRVIKSIFKASLQSGIEFEMLLMKAILESDLGRLNVASTSTARGVFQYIEPTWLVLMKRYGSDMGYPEYAQAISITRSGVPYFKGAKKFLRAEILALRYDTDTSALVKAHQIREETDMIRQYKGSAVNATDHYIAHMLGLSLAKEFYDLKRKGSIIAIAKLNRPAMREAARLNRIFFYDGKRALTASQSYKKFQARIERELRKIDKIANSKPAGICAASAQ